MLTVAVYAVIALADLAAACAIYLGSPLRDHQGGGACLRRTAAFRVTRALLRALIAVLSIRAVRTAVLRARWAWRCRTPPRNDGTPLGERERAQLITIVRGWDTTAPPERSRTW